MTTTETTDYHDYYGSRADTRPPPGMSRSTYRRRFKLGQLPGTQMPGRGGGIIVTRAEWDAWLTGNGSAAADPARIARIAHEIVRASLTKSVSKTSDTTTKKERTTK